MGKLLACVCVLGVLFGGAALLYGGDEPATATFDTKLDPAKIQASLDAAYKQYKDLKEGKNADYIPALAKVDSNIYGLALVTCDGKVYTCGDVSSEVSIQSISKVFTMALVMEEKGTKAIHDAMGVDATGQVFNSIVAIEQYKGRQMNALVNAGAGIKDDLKVATSMLAAIGLCVILFLFSVKLHGCNILNKRIQ